MTMRPFTATTAGISPVHVPATAATLVVQTVSVQVDVTSGHHTSARIEYTSVGEAVAVYLPLSFAYSEPATGYDVFHAAAPMTLYADPDTDIVLTQYSPVGTGGTSFLTVSGCLEEF
jgi:hypothetical protein